MAGRRASGTTPSSFGSSIMVRGPTLRRLQLAAFLMLALLIFVIVSVLRRSTAVARGVEAGILRNIESRSPLRGGPSADSFAYATLITNDAYSMGALALMASLQAAGAGTTVDVAFVCVTGSEVSVGARRRLLEAGYLIHELEPIVIPKGSAGYYEAYLHDAFHKLRLFEYDTYHRIVYIDSDAIVLKNLDHLFFLPERAIWAVPDSPLFNTGVMVLLPSRAVFELLIAEFTKGNMQMFKADQGVINEFFATTWSPLPEEYNCMSHMYSSTQQAFLLQKLPLGVYRWPNIGKRMRVVDAYVIHFTDTPKPFSPGFKARHYLDLFQVWRRFVHPDHRAPILHATSKELLRKL